MQSVEGIIWKKRQMRAEKLVGDLCFLPDIFSGST
jgi:hypothetical protein